MKKAVFLDRDGTLNSDRGHYYVFQEKDFILNEGVTEGLKMLQNHNYLLIVVTNQGGVAKGEYTKDDVEKVHQKMQELLRAEGVELTAIYYCPHHESIESCECRKPRTGMFKQAIKEYNIDVKKSYMIGDGDRDMEAANSIGIKGFKIEKNASIVEVCKKIVENEN